MTIPFPDLLRDIEHAKDHKRLCHVEPDVLKALVEAAQGTSVVAADDEALVEAMAKAMRERLLMHISHRKWEQTSQAVQKDWREYARVALAIARPVIEREATEKALDEALALVRKRTEPSECERAYYDLSTGAWECSRENSYHGCLCSDRMEQAEEIESEIRALKAALHVR